MKRIDTSTVAQDLFGSGLDGFTDGDAMTATPPTQLNASWFNNVQEELARCVEGNGDTLDEDNLYQVDDAVQGAAVRSVQGQDRFRVLRGLTFSGIAGGSLTIGLNEGEITFEGRRYVITDEKLAAGGFDSWTLTATRDVYFYIAPEDPDAPATPPNRATVHVETVTVTIGAGHAAPAGMELFAKVTTDGTEATTVIFYNRGPALTGSGGGVAFRAPQPIAGTGVPQVTQTGALVPVFGPVNPFQGEDIGSLDYPNVARPTNASFFNAAHLQRARRRSSIDANHPMAIVEEYTLYGTTSGGGSIVYVALSANGLSLNQSNFSNGTVVRAVIHAVAMNESDPSECYARDIIGFAQLSGGAWSSVASTELVEDNPNETVCEINFANNSGVLAAQLVAHATDQLRWFIDVKIVMTGPTPP